MGKKIEEMAQEEMAQILGIPYQEVLNEIQDYGTNDLTPEMNSEEFIEILYWIVNDLNKKKKLHLLPVSALSSYDMSSYNGGIRLLPSKAAIENIVPFLVVNKWLKVFYIEWKAGIEKNTVKDYLVVDPQVKKSQIEENIGYRYSVWYNSFNVNGKIWFTSEPCEIIRLEEITI